MQVEQRQPLSDRQQRIVALNTELQGEPCPACGRTVHVVDLTPDGTPYVSHVDDQIGLQSRTDDSKDGCRIDTCSTS